MNSKREEETKSDKDCVMKWHKRCVKNYFFMLHNLIILFYLLTVKCYGAVLEQRHINDHYYEY